MKCAPGPQFGSEHPAPRGDDFVSDLFPSGQTSKIANLRALVAMLAFDKWTSNTDKRQTVFLRDPVFRSWSCLAIDNGDCFSGSKWSFLECPVIGIYDHPSIYGHVTDMDSFEPWLSRIEQLNEDVFREAERGLPQDWLLGSDRKHLTELLDRLWSRRGQVRESIWSTIRTRPQVFPSWRRVVFMNGATQTGRKPLLIIGERTPPNVKSTLL
jgi:hypothetical protein